ncbi:hypothetical protein [Ruminococcus albus]|uniref:Uncharacterized protein n=1 Tax=Ruminococcus albus TaxID=1264 RepID=A0A1I1KSA2_RUMAL|nr:hypothetical protein [Ruminococcus albus]SFC61033.1 hypothetical protein SAMN02910406_02040 [Ruminococcus albus]
MAVVAAVIFLLTAFSLAVQIISRKKRKCRAAVVVKWCEDIPCEDEILGIIRDEEAAGEYGRQVILVSTDGRFSQRTQDLAAKYGVILAAADELADIICGQEDKQFKADTWEVKNE